MTRPIWKLAAPAIATASLIASAALSHAAITNVVEVNLGGDAPAVIEAEFDEDTLTFSDRTHEHNGAAFFDGVLDTLGDVIVPLPDYLVGNEYVAFANNARDQSGYEATVSADSPSKFYLLLDNRINGPAGNASSPNSTDPDLGGTFQWVVDGGWVRVNTGISPDDQADYTGVDESGDDVGPGNGLNQFYSVYTLPSDRTSVTVSNNGTGGSNMISLVVAPGTGGARDPISSFSATPEMVFERDPVTLSFVIDPDATAGTILPDIGDILDDIDANGVGSVVVNPDADITYTLAVTTPTGSDSQSVMVATEPRPEFRILSVDESGLGGEASAVIEPDGVGADGTLFDDDVNSYADRTHEHNGAAFFDGILDTTGDVIIDLPPYLVGQPYVRFANDAKNNLDYEATVTASTPAQWYLLLDNRTSANGSQGLNSTPPEFDTNQEWVIDGGWEEVNTGISPDDQPDFTGIDEGGDDVGPGNGLNQFFTVYTLPDERISATVRSIGTPGNQISLIAAPGTGGEVMPIVSFTATPGIINAGEASTLRWIIDPAATAATITGIGDILPLTDPQGIGNADVMPTTATEYTLAVTSPAGNDSQSQTVDITLLGEFIVDNALPDPGETVTLGWLVRPGASVSIDPIGNVDDQTDENGAGSITQMPTTLTTYTLTATDGGESDTASVTVITPVYVLIDIGATDGTPEDGAANDEVIGAAPAGTNGTILDPEIEFQSRTGDDLSILIDDLDSSEFPLGGLDWRDRGDADPNVTLAAFGEDLVKNNSGAIRAVISGLPAGEFSVTSFHIDPNFSQCEEIMILVSDAQGDTRDTGVTGDSSLATIPGTAGLTTDLMLEHGATFDITSDGTNDVILFFDGTFALDTEVPLNGLLLVQSGVAPPASELRFTSVVYDGLLNSVTITWTSKPGATYRVEASDTPDFTTVTELDDAFGSQGDSTTFTESDIPDGTLTRYYRVTEN